MFIVATIHRAAALALFGLPGQWEALIVVLVILLLFGGRKLPELARGIGRGLREFRGELKGVKKDVEDATADLDDDEEDTGGKEA